MPYISAKNDRRKKLRHGEPALNAGELNYQIFYYIKHYDWRKHHQIDYTMIQTIHKFVNKFLGKNPNYQRWNDMTGCLIRCYKEIKRRLNINVKEILIEIMEDYDNEIARYEDTKIISNSDVE